MPAHAFSYQFREDGDKRNILTGMTRGRGSASAIGGRTRRSADHRARCPVHLVRAAQSGPGRRRAFDALWRRYAPTVQGIVLTMVSDDAAQDLTQEIAIAAFRSLPSLQKPESFPAWICAIARNAGRDALAAQRRRAEVPLEDATAEDLVAGDRGDPTAADEILAQIRALPECYREPLMLRLLLELPGPKIAERLGMTEGSVRVNLCRGMKLLRERLQHWESRDE